MIVNKGADNKRRKQSHDIMSCGGEQLAAKNAPLTLCLSPGDLGSRPALDEALQDKVLPIRQHSTTGRGDLRNDGGVYMVKEDISYIHRRNPTTAVEVCTILSHCCPHYCHSSDNCHWCDIGGSDSIVTTVYTMKKDTSCKNDLEVCLMISVLCHPVSNF